MKNTVATGLACGIVALTNPFSEASLTNPSSPTFGPNRVEMSRERGADKQVLEAIASS